MALPPISVIRQFDTSRLIPSRFAGAENSVLLGIADNDQHLVALFELDNATNQRLVAELGGAAGIGIDELVFGIPNFRIINAAFTYPRPEGSRFNDAERGAWYCAFDVQTALEEIIFHKTIEYAEVNRFNDSVTYQEFLADFNASFHDLRGDTAHKGCLSPSSYIKSQDLAVQMLEADSLGVVYPSVRHAGGTNLACFRPALVGNVRKGMVFKLTWNGSPRPAVKNVSGAKAKRS